MDEEYFTIPEVAKKLKVTRAAVYKWIAQGRMEAIYVGADRRVTNTAIEAFVARSTAARTARHAADDVPLPTLGSLSRTGVNA
jgi:excisionase family DNA binding protein